MVDSLQCDKGSHVVKSVVSSTVMCGLGIQQDFSTGRLNPPHSPENNTTYFFVKSEAEVF